MKTLGELGGGGFGSVEALDVKLGLKPGANKDELIEAMAGHILAQGEMHGTYERK
jgi:hypothetical protein